MDVRIGHPLGAADDAAPKLIGNRLAAAVEFDESGKHQPVPVRHERTDVGRKLEGQHRHGTVGEVNTGSAPAGFNVNRTSRTDVMAYVGDMNLQREMAVPEPVDENGIIEIPRSLAV